MLWIAGAEVGVGLRKGKKDEKMVCNRKSRRNVVLRRKVGLSGRDWEVKGEVDESVVHFSVKQKKGILEWNGGKGMMIAIETLGEDREREEEKLEIMVEMGKEDMDLVVGSWIARRRREMQKECEIKDKKEAKQRKVEESTSDAAEDRLHRRLHECEFFSMYERIPEEK
jgi:hypothetical protein